jgi:hypothetical protein
MKKIPKKLMLIFVNRIKFLSRFTQTLTSIKLLDKTNCITKIVEVIV